MRDIPEEQVLRRLRADNPWWADPFESGSTSSRWVPRPYLDLFLPLVRAATPRRAVVLLGPRRVGKTVLIHHTIRALLDGGAFPKSLCYVSVDHPLYTGLGLEDLLDRYATATGFDPRTARCTVFFDEIQYLRDWEIHLKALVDDYPQLRCVASGSAAAALRLKSHESGAGRFTEFLLPPLTFHEFLLLLDRSALVHPNEELGWSTAPDVHELNRSFLDYLNFGGYPEAALSPEIQRDPGRFIKADIIDKVLLRDLPSLYGITDIQELNSLFNTLAYNTGQEVGLADLSQTSHVANNTLVKYLQYLQAAFLIKQVRRVDADAAHFKRATTFKVYLTNPTMRAALFGPVHEEHEAMGQLAETAVFSQWLHNAAFVDSLHYARWKKGEVDLVSLDAAGQRPRFAVEVKWGDRAFDDPKEIKGILEFARIHKLGRRPLVTTFSRAGTKNWDGIEVEYTPTALHCYTVAKNTLEKSRLKGGAA